VTVPKHHVLVMGLPRTGKTTFLAAMWDVVDSANVSGSLVLENVEGDKQYLNDIRDLWANCEEISRTGVGKEKTVSMNLRERETDLRVCVSFPDVDGEAFERQWTDREWPQSHEQIYSRSQSALLFIHPKKVKESRLIRDAGPLIAIIKASQPDEPIKAIPAEPPASPASEPPVEQTVPASPAFAPTQVQLVELLQFMQRAKVDFSGFRLGIIVSAWDKVMKLVNVTPEKWLEDSLPMLHQYLTAHHETIFFRAFGVSAQGGDLPKDAARLRKRQSPSDRIIVVEGKNKSSDITLPIRWVMGATGS
jgi:hypothetical protein